MSKSKQIRKQTLRENFGNLQIREQALLAALGNLRVVVLEVAKGENWARGYKELSLRYLFTRKTDYFWVGEGNPQERAEEAMVAVFGKDYQKQGKEEKK